MPNATGMMVEKCPNGSALHSSIQLRGRVGRGEHQSYCIFIRGNKDQETAKRLEILNHSNDGFYIASEDLKLRGSAICWERARAGIWNSRWQIFSGCRYPAESE